MNHAHHTPRVLRLAAMLCVALAPAACQQYVSSPGIPTSRGIPESPNQPAAATAMVRSIQYVANRYPPGSLNFDAASAQDQASTTVPYACVVNLPRGLRRSYYERIAAEIGPECRPMTPEVVHAAEPTFHVTRVWMRFNTAIVDVLRPMPELGTDPEGKTLYQLVTVRLEGGTEPWHVVHARAHTGQQTALPAPYFMPETERVDQYTWQQEQDDINPPDRVSY